MATIAENIQTLRSIKSDIKNAILQKGGVVTDAFGTYAQAITDLPSGGGGTEIEDALVMRTLSVYSNDRVSVVGDYAFYYAMSLKSIDLPNCLSVGIGAFYNCRLTSVNLPNCSYINLMAFYNCYSLESITLQNCTYVGKSAFYIGNLTSVNLPLCMSIDERAFGFCKNLREVYLNSVTSVTTITSNTFYSSPNLTSVYVPASLVDAFKTAPNWSSISDKIVAYSEEIPGFEVEEPGVGGVPDEGEEEGGGSL